LHAALSRALRTAVEKLDTALFTPAFRFHTPPRANHLLIATVAANTTRDRVRGMRLVFSEGRTQANTRRLAMTVIIVLLMVTIFMTLDYVFGRRSAHQAAALATAEPLPMPAPVEPVWVSGYQLPEDRFYHLGHMWVRPLGADTAAVGLDDFARRLVGPAKSLVMPTVGSKFAAGQPAFRVLSENGGASLVTPLTGEVLEVNPRLETHPALATDEPYGRGWLVKMRTRDLASGVRNLLSGSLARRWTEDARERLDLQLVALSGSVLQDGGEPVADFARHLPEEDWRRLVQEFLLT
jgi:glycine cleavage system H lipoate-binding protein